MQISTLIFLARRRSRQEDELLREQVAKSEATIDATQEDFDALADALPRTTELLEYIGTHGAHALDKWQQGIGAALVHWADLTDNQKQTHQDFVAVASCQLSVDGIDASRFMTTEGEAPESSS
ncbi:hypothetical protein [Cryobacterium sp. Hz9]|uniref:hypothetical protein n=1 Tax=Cryobacterium sp. Hz9 TaxID=1259167 RepID=UPI00106AE61F|nr:hypothetical protein [Cryobacterium sp. Hz9]TFB66156.1 hypothetical protein E3N85_09930 [Cryobacterium sp. Hz9]